MKIARIAFIAFSLACLAVILQWHFAPFSFRIARLIHDHAVLQRDLPMPIWGWGKPGRSVRLELKNTATGEMETYQTIVDSQGRWETRLKAHPAGGPYQITVIGQLNYFRRNDIVFGDVWLCAGQSNMSIKVKDSDGFAEALAAPMDSNTRYFSAKDKGSKLPQPDYWEGGWKLDEPSLRNNFSALPYYFAKQLQQHLQVPIGVVNASMGSSRIETWMPGSCFDAIFLKNVLDTAHCDEPAIAKQLPTCLFNSMIAPSAKFPVKGIIWWQGESNTEPKDASKYMERFDCLIQNWREARGDSLLPFLFVQLANISPKLPHQADTNWPGVREAQLLVSQQVNRTAMVISFDISHPSDVHPGNKKGIAERLALAARSLAYGENVVCAGPVFQKMEVENGRLRLHFNPNGSGLAPKPANAVLSGFKIGGNDRAFHIADAKIEGNNIVLRSNKVPNPVAARYAWERSPVGANLYNKEGLPASPFRTDDW
jgi:sialate O-acetylesterase